MRLEKARFVLGQIAHGMIRPQKEINAAVDTIFRELDKQIWIPVTERLPKTKEDGSWFFVTKEENETYTGSLKTVVCMTFFDEYHQRFECSGRTVAWMPIIFPEPFKGGDA